MLCSTSFARAAVCALVAVAPAFFEQAIGTSASSRSSRSGAAAVRPIPRVRVTGRMVGPGQERTPSPPVATGSFREIECPLTRRSIGRWLA